MEQLPKFDAPPVVETVLSAQFSRLKNYSNAHAGWFWKNYLAPEWSEINEVPRLNDQFERFGDDRSLWTPSSTLSVRPGPESERLQIIRDDQERMIQVQDSRFIYNWRRRDRGYPSFDKIYPEFRENFEKFREFARAAGNDDLALNQWEVTYVNHLFQGELWKTPDDLSKVIPGLFVSPATTSDQKLESVSGEWHLTIGEQLGRLHISMKHVRVGGVEGPEAIAVTLTARGGVDHQDDGSLERGLMLGREVIVRTFADITSEAAHKHWQRSA